MATRLATLPRRFLWWLSGGRPLTFARPPFAPEFALIHRPLTEDGAHVIATQLALGAAAPQPSRRITEADIRQRLEQATLADADASDIARVVAVLQEAGFPADLDDRHTV